MGKYVFRTSDKVSLKQVHSDAESPKNIETLYVTCSTKIPYREQNTTSGIFCSCFLSQKQKCPIISPVIQDN